MLPCSHSYRTKRNKPYTVLRRVPDTGDQTRPLSRGSVRRQSPPEPPLQAQGTRPPEETTRRAPRAQAEGSRAGAARAVHRRSRPTRQQGLGAHRQALPPGLGTSVLERKGGFVFLSPGCPSSSLDTTALPRSAVPARVPSAEPGPPAAPGAPAPHAPATGRPAERTLAVGGDPAAAEAGVSMRPLAMSRRWCWGEPDRLGHTARPTDPAQH